MVKKSKLFIGIEQFVFVLQDDVNFSDNVSLKYIVIDSSSQIRFKVVERTLTLIGAWKSVNN